MRKIRYSREFKGTNVYCTYCKPLKVKAIYRHDSFFSCNEHKIILEDLEKKEMCNDDEDSYAMYSINSNLNKF